MTRIVSAAAVALVLAACPILGPKPAAAQPELKNDMIEFEYVEPRTAKYKPIYQHLKEIKLLERLAQFLSPLKLQGGLVLSLEEGGPACRGPNSYYDMAGKLHLCYSWFYLLENEASVEVKREPNEPFTSTSLGLMPGFTRSEVLIGGTVGVILHEMGHALFDIQDIPLFGREEDGADQIAALIMLQFGPKVALTTIKGFYNVWHHFNAEMLRATKGQIRPWAEADEHSISIQRAYNFLCMAYGKDPQSFGQLADNLLPRARKQSCQEEYKQAANAFRKTILPDIDPEMMKAVLQLEILKPEDFK